MSEEKGLAPDAEAKRPGGKKTSDVDPIAQLEADRNALLKKRAFDARTQQIADQRAHRAAQKKIDSAEAIVELKHGTYVDHQTYTHDDSDRPPAVVGDYITVTAKEAKRLVKEGVAELVAV